MEENGENLWKTTGGIGPTNTPNWFEEIQRAKVECPDYSIMDKYAKDLEEACRRYSENQKRLALSPYGVWVMWA